MPSRFKKLVQDEMKRRPPEPRIKSPLIAFQERQKLLDQFEKDLEQAELIQQLAESEAEQAGAGCTFDVNGMPIK